MAVEQVDLLTGEGLDPERVVIGHIDNHPELDYVRRVLDRGVSVGFDSVGKQDWDVRVPPRPGGPDGPYAKAATRQSDTTQVDRLARLVADGYAGQILLPQDLAGAAVIYPDGADHHCWWADTPQQEHDALAGLAALLDQHPDLRVVTWADGAADIPGCAQPPPGTTCRTWPRPLPAGPSTPGCGRTTACGCRPSPQGLGKVLEV